MTKPKKPSIFAVRDATFLKGPIKAVFLSLAMRENKSLGYAWPSINKIAEDCGYSDRSVQRALKKLEYRGLMVVIRRRGQSNRYKIDWHAFFRRDAQARAVLGRHDAQETKHKTMVRTDCRGGAPDRSATMDSLTPKESRIPSEDPVGFDELEALEGHQRKYGVDAEMAFMGVLDKGGHRSLVQTLAPDGTPNFRLMYDPSQQTGGERHDIYLIWHHAAVGKFKGIAIILAPMGFRSSNLYSAVSFEKFKTLNPDRFFVPVPNSVLLEEVSFR
jgi:DNA-binding transcriptional ArsR family regulator